MSAWWVLGALGLYPAVPGADVLALNSPLFREARLRTSGGAVRIAAPAAARGRPYVRWLALDGRRLDRPGCGGGSSPDALSRTSRRASS